MNENQDSRSIQAFTIYNSKAVLIVNMGGTQNSWPHNDQIIGSFLSVQLSSVLLLINLVRWQTPVKILTVS